jgi:hypothetical protein
MGLSVRFCPKDTMYHITINFALVWLAHSTLVANSDQPTKRIGKHIHSHDAHDGFNQQTDQRKSEDLHVYLSVHIDGYAEVAQSL